MRVRDAGSRMRHVVCPCQDLLPPHCVQYLYTPYSLWHHAPCPVAGLEPQKQEDRLPSCFKDDQKVRVFNGSWCAEGKHLKPPRKKPKELENQHTRMVSSLTHTQLRMQLLLTIRPYSTLDTAHRELFLRCTACWK